MKKLIGSQSGQPLYAIVPDKVNFDVEALEGFKATVKDLLSEDELQAIASELAQLSEAVFREAYMEGYSDGRAQRHQPKALNKWFKTGELERFQRKQRVTDRNPRKDVYLPLFRLASKIKCNFLAIVFQPFAKKEEKLPIANSKKMNGCQTC